ncbi:homoserine kinase [Aureispira]|nr:homoserine kinase [Aureispira sp.]
MKKICAFAPATIANLSVGFDVLGIALDSLGDQVELTINGTVNNKIIEIINGNNLPIDIQKNCCSVVIRKMQEHLKSFQGVNIRILKGFKSGSGLGSSSASSAASVYAYNTLMGNPFTEQELIAFAAEGERIACGSAHADNVAPSIIGGLVLIRSHNPVDVIRLPIPDHLHAVLLFPDVKINTSDSREVMQKNISLETACGQWANLGAFVASLYQNDLKLLTRSMQDLVVEPIRSLFIPKFQELKNAALNNGALGFGISGSGPSVFAIAAGRVEAEMIEKAMCIEFEDTSIEIMSFVESLNGNHGCRIVESF